MTTIENGSDYSSVEICVNAFQNAVYMNRFELTPSPGIKKARSTVVEIPMFLAERITLMTTSFKATRLKLSPSALLGIR